MMLDAVVEGLSRCRNLAHKADIAGVVRTLGIADPARAIPVGDDCAAIPDGDGWLLLAIEGFINEFVEKDPWFAGWCGLMVNCSDIYAMGGRPIAIVDAIWANGEARMRPVLQGLAAASKTYGVPIVGGHSNARSDAEQLSVAVLGRANKLMTSFDASPGDVLIAAIDVRGAYREPYAHWNATTGVDPARLRGDLELLPQLAESGLCVAAKDISQAGIIGTTIMLLECSGVGGVVELDDIPRPTDAEPLCWLLSAFPSFGYIFAVAPRNVPEVLAHFRARDIACAAIGLCDDTHRVSLTQNGDSREIWNLQDRALTGCGYSPSSMPSSPQEFVRA